MEVNPTRPILSPAPAIGPRLFPAFSLVRPTFSEARSWYDSFQASARMRPWRGINALASYTLSHAVDHVSGLNIGGESRPMLPVTIGDQASIDTALVREKGDALFDARHRFVLSFGYELPQLSDRNTATRLTLGGWQANGIIQGQTGFPLTVTEPNNVSLTSLTNRPNMICDPNEGGARTTAQWFNTSCFQRLTVAANGGQIGNEPRNAVRGAWFFSRGSVVLQELRGDAESAAAIPRRGLQRLQSESLYSAGQHSRLADVRRDHERRRRPDRAARHQVHVLTLEAPAATPSRG
jgi:hypothetical protein